MRKLHIAVCKNRYTGKYKNQDVEWLDFLSRLKETTRTHETQAEYLKMTKIEQANVKDVGGYVAGQLSNGIRNNQSVLSRSMITLDLDYAPKDFWLDVQLDLPNAAALYSTHKHSDQTPKYRLVVPLSRDVDAEEYEAVARKLSATWDMDYFDDTTYQPARLMFWPSTSKDGDYVFESQEGEFLNPDEVLSEYADWHDVSLWPRSSRVDTLRKRSAQKQGDPLEKDGMIGAFCKTYDIHQAIATFLSEVYTPTSRSDRYTYVKGSTAGGLVIYEDKFAYSNHATDPISGYLCNAFDLVRIHRFHHLDAEIADDTPINRRPSWGAMMDFCRDDEPTRKTYNKERVKEALKDFKDDFEKEGHEKDLDWTSKLEVDKRGQFKASTDNIVLILENDPRLRGKVGGFDEFNQKPIKFADLPWAPYDPSNPGWTDEDDAGLRYLLEKDYHIVARGKCDDAIVVVHQRHAFHPVRDYLEGLIWDGEPRLDTLFIDFLGAEESPYMRAITRKSIVAAVARVMTPGCKYDYMPVFTGRQGIGKSQLLSKLGGKWFSDSITTVSGKEGYEALHGSWIIEMAELTATRKSDIEQTKQFISKQTDRYRKAYARRVTDNPRQCVFFGTTNDDEFLRDYTGNRRFWPVDTEVQPIKKSLFKEMTSFYRNQIWAEAVVRWKEKEPLFLEEELEKVAMEKQEEHTYTSVRDEQIANYLDRLLPEGWEAMTATQRKIWLDDEENVGTVRRDKVSMLEIWVEALGGGVNNFSNVDQREVRAIMSRLKWERSKNPMSCRGSYGYKKQRLFIRPGTYGGALRK